MVGLCEKKYRSALQRHFSGCKGSPDPVYRAECKRIRRQDGRPAAKHGLVVDREAAGSLLNVADDDFLSCVVILLGDNHA